MKRAFFFRPLALALAFLLMPRVPDLPIPSGVLPAAAQTITIGGAPPPCDPGTHILRTCDADWVQFEKEVVDSYLLAHRIPLADEGLVYQYGRADLRNEIRALMLTRLMHIIRTDGRSTLDQAIYSKFQAQIWNLQKTQYSNALADYQSWRADPCHWNPHPVVADANNLYYDRASFCGLTGLYGLLMTPKVPTRNYFLMAAMKSSYNAPFGDMAASVVLADTTVKMPAAAAVAAAAGGAVAATWIAVAVVAGDTLAKFIFPYAFYSAAVIATKGAIASFSTVAGPAAILAIAVIIGVTVGFDVVQQTEYVNQLNAFSSEVSAVNANAPDLRQFLNDSTGYLKLSTAFVGMTLPDMPSSQTLPCHGATDAAFITNNGAPSATFTYRDWDGASWTGTSSGGWLVLTNAHTGEMRFSPSFQAVSADTGANVVVSRAGGAWFVSKASPNSTDIDCPAALLTGVTPDTVSTGSCRSFVHYSANIHDGNNQNASLSMSQPPVFSSIQDPAFSFTTNVAHSVTFTASGAPLPSLSADGLPSGMTFDSSSIVGAGMGTLNYVNAQPGDYYITLKATNVQGTTTKQIHLIVMSDVHITSTSNVGFQVYVPGKFTVTTTGYPVKIATNVSWSDYGLTFKDNGDGTATLSGTPTGPDPITGGLVNGVTYGFTASNAISSEHQTITISIGYPADPTLNASSTTFVAGVPNSFRFSTLGDAPVAPKIVDFCPGTTSSNPYVIAPGPNKPSWLQIIDNGDGTGELRGTPPIAAADYVAQAKIGASYDPNYFTECQIKPIFNINVSTAPRFTAGNFGVSLGGDTNLTITSNVTGGTITAQGALPPGLTFTDNGNGTATIAGRPSTGGQFPLTLRLTSGQRSTSQTYTLYVLQAPTYQGISEVMFHTDQPNSFTLTGTGFPKSPTPDLANYDPNLPGLQYGMGFGTNSPMPGGITFRDASKWGPHTGSAVLSGSPSSTSIGDYTFNVVVYNGWGQGQTFPFKLHIVKAGDLNEDGVVDCKDYLILKSAMGGVRGTTNYDFRADVNNDGLIDVTDENFLLARMTDYSCVGTPPTMTITANPPTIRLGQPITFSGTATTGSDLFARSPLTVQCDLSPIGGSSTASFPVPASGSPQLWNLSQTVPITMPVGQKTIACSVSDLYKRNSTQTALITVRESQCGDPKVPIGSIQGNGPVSPIVGTVAEVEGVVTGAFQGANRLNGYFIQDEGDGDPTTSDGIFIDESSRSLGLVQPGQKVRVRGVVAETKNLTTLSGLSLQLGCPAGAPVAPVDISLPVVSTDFFEKYEGMLVRFPQQLWVTDTSNLGTFNEVGLAAPPQPVANQSLGTLFAPTQLKKPGVDAAALQSLNDLSRIVLDDGSQLQYDALDPALMYPVPLSASQTLRRGTRLNVGANGTYTPLVGVLTQGSDLRYRVEPTGPVTFNAADNPRPTTPPAVPGRVRLAALSSLQYFTTPKAGGADSAAELARQRSKIVSGLLAIDPAVITVTSIENNGGAALTDLVNALNASAPGKYSYVNTGILGNLPAVNAFIYQHASIQPVGPFKVLDSTLDPRALTQRNTPAIAQTFKLLTGESPDQQYFTVVITQLKDRTTRCDADSPVDPDRQDGQGNCNLTRVSMVRALLDWLAKNPTADPTPAEDACILIVGDLNGYLMEDPVRALTDPTFSLPASAVFPNALPAAPAANYLNLASLVAAATYSGAASGQSGTLDYALGNPALYRAVSAISRWRINADEPLALDYNLDFSANGVSEKTKSATQQSTLFSANPFRLSPVDPLVIGFNPLCGDFNDDGVVDHNDQKMLTDLMNQPTTNPRLDLDLDGRITPNDLHMFLSCKKQAK